MAISDPSIELLIPGCHREENYGSSSIFDSRFICPGEFFELCLPTIELEKALDHCIQKFLFVVGRVVIQFLREAPAVPFWATKIVYLIAHMARRAEVAETLLPQDPRTLRAEYGA